MEIGGNKISVWLASERHTHTIKRRELNNGVLISNLIGPLSELKEHDLKDMFDTFGEIELVDVFEEIYESEKNSGLAVMIFQRGDDA